MAADAELVKRERARTRENIERVTSDQPGALDNANTLGQMLKPLAKKAGLQQNAATKTQADKARPASGAPVWDDQLPVITKPGVQRWVRRPAPQDQGDSKTPTYTPDFSRQRLTLAGLAGQMAIDLPNQEISPSTDTAQPGVAPRFSQEAVVGLADLVNIGLSYSPVMSQVQAQLDSALARSQQSRAELMPRASLRYASGPERSATTAGEDSHTTSSTSARLTQPIVNIPLIRDWMSDLNTRQAAEWRMQAARESVSLAVTNATIALATARMVLDFSDEQLKEFNELLAYVQTRTQAGAASQADLERTRTRVLLARQVRIEQQAAYKNALLEIERLTGQKPTALQLPYLNQLPGLPATQAELRTLVNDNSYELRALREDIAAQKNMVSAQYGKLWPVFGLSLERDEGINARGTNPRQVDNRLLGVMTWEFSLGGKEIFSGRGAQSELANRQSKLNEESDRMRQSADADFALLQSASLRVTAGDAEQKASAAVVVAIREQMRTGRIGSLLEALDALERHFAARQRLAQTLGQQMQAQAQLLRRLGMLSSIQKNASMALAPSDLSDKPVRD